MPEGVAAGATGQVQDVLVDGLTQRGVQAGRRQRHGVGEHAVRHLSPRDGRETHDRTSVVGQLVQPDQQQVGEQPRPLACVGQPIGGSQQLLDEERIAIGTVDDVRNGGVRERAGV